MPRYRADWESEYRDPISDAEDERQRELEERMNAEIMVEIELCRRMEEDREFAEAERREWAEILKYEQELYDEDPYWTDHQGGL